MRVTIPYAYVAEVKTATGNEVTRTFVESFEFEVQSIGSADAPVVMRHPGFRAEAVEVAYAHAQGDGPASRDIRLFDGKLFEPMHVAWFDPVKQSMGPWPVFDSEENPEHLLVRAIRPGPASLALDAKWKGPPKPSTVVHSDRDRAVAEMEDFARSFVVIDGHVHVQIPEPIYLADEKRVFCAIYDPNLPKAHMFRLTEFREAVERAALLGNCAPSEVRTPPMELLESSWLHEIAANTGWLEAGFMEISKTLEDELAVILPSQPMDIVMAFADLRDARTSTYAYGKAGTIDDVAEKLRVLVDALSVNRVFPDQVALAMDALRVRDKRYGLGAEDEAALAL